MTTASLSLEYGAVGNSRLLHLSRQALTPIFSEWEEAATRRAYSESHISGIILAQAGGYRELTSELIPHRLYSSPRTLVRS